MTYEEWLKEAERLADAYATRRATVTQLLIVNSEDGLAQHSRKSEDAARAALLAHLAQRGTSETKDGIRILPAQAERVETGPVQFGDDWPGVFIRGDNAYYYAGLLRSVIEGADDGLTLACLQGLHAVLTGSDLTGLSRRPLAAAPRAALPAAQPIPEGWKLVPVVPTLQMLESARKKFFTVRESLGAFWAESAIYRELLAAAPQARQEQPDSVHLTSSSGEAATARDAARYRWLTEDHADPATREKCRELLYRMPVMSYAAASHAIDCAMQEGAGE